MSIYLLLFAILQVCVAVYYIVTKKRIALIILTTVLVATVIVSAYLVFHGDPEEKAYLDSFNSQEVKSNIENYLDGHIITAGFGGKVFCSYQFLGARGIEDRDEVYVWTVCEEYYLKDNALAQGTATSLPVALVFKNNVIIEQKVPRDGSPNSEDIKKLFPKDVQTQINFDHRNANFISDLSAANRLKARSEFKINQ